MGSYKKTPAQKEKDKLYRRTVRAKQKEKSANRSRAGYMRQYRETNKKSNGTFSSTPGAPQFNGLLGSAPSTPSFSFSFPSQDATPTTRPANIVPMSAPPAQVAMSPARIHNLSAPPALAAMTPSQTYNLEVKKLQAELYANTNAKLAVGFETVTALADQLRSNCKEGVNALGQKLDSHEEVKRDLFASHPPATVAFASNMEMDSVSDTTTSL